MKTCKKCGKEKQRTDFYKLSGKQYKSHWDCRDSYCIECRIKYGDERRKTTKRLAVEYLGGKCIDCGLETNIYSVYDFHHLDPDSKDFAIGRNYKIFESIKSELDKCILLCANCHRIRHSD